MTSRTSWKAGQYFNAVQKIKSRPFHNVVRYKPLERGEKQVDWHIAEKISDENSKTDWRDLLITEQDSVYLEKFIKTVSHAQNMSDGHLRSTRLYSIK